MKSSTERAVVLARYLVETGDTVRGAAKKFGISKSTVHKDLTKKLRHLDAALWKQVAAVLTHNREERHLRGGAATREKYKRLREGA